MSRFAVFIIDYTSKMAKYKKKSDIYSQYNGMFPSMFPSTWQSDNSYATGTKIISCVNLYGSATYSGPQGKRLVTGCTISEDLCTRDFCNPEEYCPSDLCKLDLCDVDSCANDTCPSHTTSELEQTLDVHCRYEGAAAYSVEFTLNIKSGSTVLYTTAYTQTETSSFTSKYWSVYDTFSADWNLFGGSVSVTASMRIKSNQYGGWSGSAWADVSPTTFTLNSNTSQDIVLQNIYST